MAEITRLFEPIKIGSMTLKNRIVMEGFTLINHETGAIGYVNQKYIDFFEERAKGGAGLIITGDMSVEYEICIQDHLCIENDEFKPGLSTLTEAVHVWGAKVAPDLVHFSGRIHKEMCPVVRDNEEWRPSSSSSFVYEDVAAKEMNSEEISAVQEKFVNGAVRAKAAGFDALQLAGGFGFLIHQFLSLRYNRRTDKYGGSLDNRMRFAVEIVEKIKDKIGDSIPIIFRMSADEFAEGGLRIEDSIIIAQRLQKVGVDILNVAAGVDVPGKLHLSIPPMGSPQGPLVHLGGRIKQAVDIPVMVAGRITDPSFAEKLLADGIADMVGMARQLAADPEWPAKVAQDRRAEIVPCIGCNVCLQRLLERRVSRCSVNAAMGRERDFRITPALKSRDVLIIGGGPAGLETARIAALRGHRVSLYEEDRVLGGQLVIAAVPPYKNELKQLCEYLIRQVRSLDININLNACVTEETINQIAANVVIVATGARPLVPDLPGINRSNVLTAWDVLKGGEVGHRVVILGGGLVGCETAEFLVQQNKKVTIVEILPRLAADVEETNRSALLERFEKYDIIPMVNTSPQAIMDYGLKVVLDGKESIIEADTIVIAVGSLPNNMLCNNLQRKKREVYMVGDCAKPGRIVDAINSASYIARQI